MWRLGLLVACACNQIFDIANTGLTDSDGDGVSDDKDNCPLVANRDQANVDHDVFGDICDPCLGPQLGVDDDHDGIDDACDPCPTGSNHDEDGDGLLDGCDLCPGQSDNGADADGDGIGDACDLAPGTPNVRVMFDAFAPPSPSWNTGFQPWQAFGDTFGPVLPIEGNFIGAYRPDVQPVPGGWSMTTVVRLDTSGMLRNGLDAGIFAVTDNGGFSSRQCTVVFDGTSWHANFTTTPIAVDHPLVLQLRELPAATECWIDGARVDSQPHSISTLIWQPLIRSGAPAEFSWVDFIR